ncbi:PilZ domain-containing protein [Rhodoplanes sp. Z2-YC6860]|uniref:PilZ domain-containing protein n=1 Tax=Rhodoplanes sp. Z2-YC6860 TaxID=674703 RepID=UPI00082C834E|nr:PilZ domain-containing protein [Rhodoplanes sp. Z2-YC6860]
MEERRKLPRQRTFKGGVIIFGTAPAVECTIRNLTDTGAGLEVGTPTVVPDHFTLLIKPERLQRSCQVIWRQPGKIGVRFE